MTVSSLLMMLFSSPSQAFPAMIDGASGAIALALKLCAIYAIWLSVLDVMNKLGMSKALGKACSPLTRKLFKGEDGKTRDLITLNFTANFLGMGGAATPLGIKAMERMQDGTERATDNMILFLVINATSIQLIPATVVGLRAAAGSASPGDIILPSLLATTVSTIAGVIVVKTLVSIKKPRKQPLPPVPLEGARFE